MAKEQPKEVRVRQWQVYFDDVNNEYVKIKNTEREQSYEARDWERLTTPSKDLNGKNQLEYAGWRYEVIGKSKTAKVDEQLPLNQ